MCDASNILQSSVLLWTLSLIPATIFPYLALGLLSTSFIIYALRYNCPAVRVDRLKNEITVVEEILTDAKAKCIRDYLALVEAETRFLRTKLAVSRLHSRLLEARNIPGWKNYLHDIFTISRALAILERQVRDIKTSLLVLIEAAHQRKLTEDIREGQEIGDGVLQPYYSRIQTYSDIGIEPLHFNLAGLVLAVGNPAPYTVPNLLVFVYFLCEFVLGRSILSMVHPSQAQAQSDAFFMAEGFLAASLVLDDDLNIDLFNDEDNFEADLIADDTLELFEFSALNWIAIAEQMTGRDTRGPYNLIP
ncbi:hypothetical protein DFH08DRAFT_936598, partial [Mycena albidolilacea]